MDKKIYIYLFLFSPTLYGMWDLSSPEQGSNPCSLQWKRRGLTTGHQGSPEKRLLCLHSSAPSFFRQIPPELACCWLSAYCGGGGWVRAEREEVMGDAEGGQHRRAARSGVCSYRDKNTYKQQVVQVLEEAIKHNPDSGFFFSFFFFLFNLEKISPETLHERNFPKSF